ncbi:MAG: cobalamin-dependent protein [Thermoplasmatales archaeon]|nr:MAG: cobalamin-dependent protein [Thermoplasmatales archaeon]
MVNINLVFAPFWSPVMPPHGIACLSSFLKENGHDVRTIDLNVELPSVYKLFKKMLSMPIDLEATVESLSYPFLISLFYDEKDCKNVLKDLIKDRTLFGNNYLENNVDWLLNNKLKRTIKYRIGLWVKNILDDDPDIVGFSTLCTNFPLSLLIAKEIKKERRDILTILGGAHVFWFKEETMRNLPWIDVIVKGEGEMAFLKIIDELKNNSLPKRHIVSEPYLKDINNLPPPDFSDFDFEKYIYGAIPISMSRGCVYNCSFCHEKRFWKNFRSKKPETIVKEIETDLERYNLDSFLFCDSLINGNTKLLEKYCELIVSKGIDIYWSAHASIRSMDEALLKKMKNSGCRCLLYGIESGSQRILNKMHKGIALKEIERVLKLTMGMNIWPLTYWLIGFPGESIADINKTKDFIIKNRDSIGSAVFHSFILSRVTPIYNNPQDYGISIDRRPQLDKIDHFLWSHNYTVKEGISHKEVLKQTINCRKEINFDCCISMYFPLNRELYPLFYKERMSGKLKDQWYGIPDFNVVLNRVL